MNLCKQCGSCRISCRLDWHNHQQRVMTVLSLLDSRKPRISWLMVMFFPSTSVVLPFVTCFVSHLHLTSILCYKKRWNESDGCNWTTDTLSRILFALPFLYINEVQVYESHAQSQYSHSYFYFACPCCFLLLLLFFFSSSTSLHQQLPLLFIIFVRSCDKVKPLSH